MKIAIAGASGFVGSELMRALLAQDEPKDISIIAISRGTSDPVTDPRVEWRRADLLDADETRAAVRGADVAVYLVHAMLPQARLVQGNFADFDLLQADNFARACSREKMKRIVYLGGIIPEGTAKADLSPHLRSRVEVESALAAYGNRLTTLRAGLVFGRGGSSSEVLFRLVRRLPLMLTPKWTSTPTEPVHIADVVYGLSVAVTDESLSGQAWDLGAGEVLSYREVIALTAETLGLKRTFISVPIFTPKLSRLWVSLVTGAPWALISPLIESLAHAMIPREANRLFKRIGHQPRSVREAIRDASQESPTPHAYRAPRKPKIREGVRSVQRFSPKGAGWETRSSEQVADLYFDWLPKFLFGLIRVQKNEAPGRLEIRFRLPLLGTALLVLVKATGPNPDEANLSPELALRAYRIEGGLLNSAGKRGFLEFRVVRSSGVVIASLQDFVPRLPWTVYLISQAKIHLWVMRRFERAL